MSRVEGRKFLGCLIVRRRVLISEDVKTEGDLLRGSRHGRVEGGREMV